MKSYMTDLWLARKHLHDKIDRLALLAHREIGKATYIALLKYEER